MIWEKYEKGRRYLDSKGIVGRTEKNWNFYLGKQWVGLETGGKNFPCDNIIKPVVKYKIATIAQNIMTAVYSDMEDRTEFVEVCKTLDKEFQKKWEKAKMNTISWKVLKGAAVEGSHYVYYGTDDIRDAQIIHESSIMFGNEQETEIQKQPYIIIYDRLLVEDVRRMAKENGVKEWELITSDDSTEYEIGNKEEVGDKCTCIIYFEKKDGIVYMAQATKGVVFEPLHPLAPTRNGEYIYSDGKMIGLRSYPIVSMIWEEMPNSARGNSEVEPLIPNQIEINKTLVRRSMSVKMTAYPRIAYDTSAISNPEDLEKVGTAIGMNGLGNVDQTIKYLNPASMSHDAESLLLHLESMTRELAGAGDAATGNIDPTEASGKSIIAVRDQMALPLNEQQSSYKQFVEDVASLWLDMDIAYHPEGLEVNYLDEKGEVQTEYITFEQLTELKPSIRIDVSSDNGWTKYAEQSELANLLSAGHITFEEYLEALPEGSPIPKNKLKALVNRRVKDGDLQMQEMRQGVPEGGIEEIQSAQYSL